jgi:hypothetical protein
MKYFFKPELFSCIRDFSQLNGWQRIEAIFGTHPDVRQGVLLYEDRSRHYWPSQKSRKHERGYAEFESGRRFDLKGETINGQEVYIFPKTPITENLWRIQNAQAKIMGWWENASIPDRKAVTEISTELKNRISVAHCFRPFAIEEIVAELIAMGLRDLEDLASLLETKKALISAVAA